MSEPTRDSMTVTTATVDEHQAAAVGRDLFGRRLALIVAVGVVTRVVLWAAKWNRKLSLNDSLYYSVQASDLAHGYLY
ncbi:MAG: hypothetical protein ABIQ39_17005, partial [Ilumatobacteraceae bacterium]